MIKSLPFLFMIAVLALSGNSVAQEAKVPDKAPARHKLIAWLKANHSDGPECEALQTYADLMDRDFFQTNNYSVLVGRNSTRSRKAYVLDVWADSFFVTPLSEEYAAKMGLKPDSVSFRTGTKNLDRKADPLPISIQEVILDQGKTLSGSKRITGRLAYDILGDPPKNLAVRLSYAIGNNTSSTFFHLEKALPGKKGVLPFDFPSVNRPGENEFVGPVMVFLEMATIVDSKYTVSTTIYSNTIALLLEIVEP